MQNAQRVTPDWIQVCELIRIALIEGLQAMDEALANGAEPMYVAAEVLSELKLAFAAIEADPSDLVDH